MDINAQGILNSNQISEIGVADGLKGWFPLENDTNDYASSNDGINNGAIASPRGYLFDGTDDYITVDNANNNLSPGLLSFSVAFWIKTTSGQNERIFSRSHYLQDFEIWKTTGIRATIADGSTRIYGTSSSIADGVWHHIVASYDRFGYCKTYIDSSLDRQDDISSMSSVNIDPPSMVIGAYTSSNYFFTGQLHDLRFFHKALTPEEVQILHTMTDPELNSRMKKTKDRLYIKGQFEE